MLYRMGWVTFVVSAFMACTVPAIAGGKSGHSGAAHHAAGRPVALNNTAQFLRAENGIFGPAWAYPGPAGWNAGNLGYGIGGGFGGGYGYGWPGYGYTSGVIGPYVERMPYFSQFPPVYYGYASGAIYPKTAIRCSWAGGPATSSMEAQPTVVTPPRPLIIVNPFCQEPAEGSKATTSQAVSQSPVTKPSQHAGSEFPYLLPPEPECGKK